MTRSGGSDEQRHERAVERLPLVAIVDDDASCRTSSRRLVRSFGYRAEAFATGAELLASPLLTAAACVLLDVRMPDMDGLEIQRQLIARGVNVPVIFMSGRASDAEEHRARSAGAVDVLRKPVDTARLRELFQQVISDTGGSV